jgi:hypothetical protein
VHCGQRCASLLLKEGQQRHLIVQWKGRAEYHGLLWHQYWLLLWMCVQWSGSSGLVRYHRVLAFSPTCSSMLGHCR